MPASRPRPWEVIAIQRFRSIALLLLSLLPLTAGCGASALPTPPRLVVTPLKSTGPAARKPAGPPALPGTIGVIVENSPQARPQAGLRRADMVYEILAEGGITRFLALYHNHAAARIGPVRSTRIYFDQLAAAYHIPFAHAGGNVNALLAIRPLGIENIDQIYGSGAYFWRSSSRLAPHNLYTSTALLSKAVAADGYTEPSFPLPPTGALPAGGAPATRITLTYADNPGVYVYQAGWVWNHGQYGRTVNGSPALMQDGRQVTSQNVAVMVVPIAPSPDPYTPGAIKLLWQDPGPFYLFRNGRVFRGTWQWTSHGPIFLSAGGTALPFATGQTWIECIPVLSNLSYS